MSRRKENKMDFGEPRFGDWALLGLGAAFTGWSGSRIYKKHKQAKERRRSWEEQWDSDDIVSDYDSGYYLR